MVNLKKRDLALSRLKYFLEKNKSVAFSAQELAAVANVESGTARQYLQNLAGNGFLKSYVRKAACRMPETVLYKWGQPE